jgi:16S rRNA processing protein RimM
VNTPESPQAAYVTVARILRPHGRRGEVACEILTDFPQRFKSLRFAELRGVPGGVHGAAHGGARSAAGDGARQNAARRVAVRSCWISHSRGGQAIFHFEGCDSIDDAKKLVGLDVQVPLADRVKLPAGSYFITDLEGCEVRDVSGANAGEPGELIGRVGEVQIPGEGLAGTPILVVDSLHGELLIPLAQEICVRVDTAARAIDVVLPEGLRDLNK